MDNVTAEYLHRRYGYSYSHLRKLAREVPGVAEKHGRAYVFSEKMFRVAVKLDVPPKKSLVDLFR